MKEYYLIEVSEYETLKDRSILEKNNYSNIQKEILKFNTLNKDAILNISNDLQETNRIQSIKERFKSKQIDHENDFDYYFL